MLETFDFCPHSRVIKEIAPDEADPINMNGWDFTIKPSDPYRRKFSVQLHGMRWRLSAGQLDFSVDTEVNAGRLLDFYREHRMHTPFILHHEYLGPIECKFASPVNIEPALPNSGGLVEAFEVQLIHNNPGY